MFHVLTSISTGEVLVYFDVVSGSFHEVLFVFVSAAGFFPGFRSHPTDCIFYQAIPRHAVTLKHSEQQDGVADT